MLCLLIEELTLVCVHVNLWLKAKWLSYHILPTHQVYHCATFLFPELKMALNGGTFNDTTMVRAKLWGTLVTFQTVHFRKCFKWVAWMLSSLYIGQRRLLWRVCGLYGNMLWRNKFSPWTNLWHHILSYNVYEHLSSSVNALDKGHSVQELAVIHKIKHKKYILICYLCMPQQWITVKVDHMWLMSKDNVEEMIAVFRYF